MVSVRGHSGSWAFGEFAASPQFAAFAPVFANWSSLMHAEARRRAAQRDSLGKAARLSTSLMHFATLVLENPEARHQIRQLNIDGGLIEWKR